MALPALLSVLCLIQVLTLVAGTGTAGDCGYDGSLLALKTMSLKKSSLGPFATFHPEVVHYSPNRAGVRLGVMGTSSFLPGVQIFTALEQKTRNELRV